MSTGKRKDARFDLRLDSALVASLEAWLTKNPSVKSKTHAMEIALKTLIDRRKGSLIILTDEQQKILNNHRRSLDEIPDIDDVIDDLIRSLEKD